MKVILIVNNVHMSCILLRQQGDNIIVCCQDRIIIAIITSKCVDGRVFAQLVDDKVLLDLATII